MKKLFITLGIVLVVLLAADFGAAATAEHQVAKKLRAQLRLPQDPNVDINGFPFLTQAFAGDYPHVEMAANSVAVSQFQNLGVEATLHHARVSTSEVLAGNANKIDVDQLAGRIRLKAPDVGRLFGIHDLTIAPAPPEALNDGGTSPASIGNANAPIDLRGTTNIAGQDLKVRVVGVLSLVDGQLKVDPRKLELDSHAMGPIPLPPVFERSLLRQFETTLDPGMFPFKIKPTAVRAEPGALLIEGTAHNVTVGPNGMTTR